MRIIDPQTAVLTNVEVLAYLTSNPPRRPPPSSGNWAPSPDLRDHNTVVKEIHNYASRLSPHLLRYPRYTARPSSSQSKSQSQAAMTGTLQTSNLENTEADVNSLPPAYPSTETTPMDNALRDLVVRLQPYGLTKAEVVMILNLGVGVTGNTAAEGAGEEGANGGEAMEVDEEARGEEGEEDDYTAVVLMDSVIEERELRLSDDDVKAILAIIKETLTADYENVKG
ncbi:hypothetical protein N7505_002532 [Penicillium chrysogenum]|uniref:DNA-directed RNA polymerase III subunit RPC9 n=1 Tax=Penicillium chrysogenum TaxID=5076 RepID=A0ABQ8X091_PENCH|nr:hypothetical protein N7505_002532 [Penicillium chrysogenum]